MTSCKDTDDLYELFDRCNHTELYQLVRELGLPNHPAMPKEELIGVLLGLLERQELRNEADVWRDALMKFLLDNWKTVRGQLDCPAKSGDPRSCYNCIDTQVLACLVQNKGNLVQIHNRRR